MTRSFTLGIVALGVLTGALVAGPLYAEPESESIDKGRDYVEATCVVCHRGPQLDVVVSRRLGAHNREALGAFLATHHVADAALRVDVLAYLEARLASAPTDQ